VRAVSIFTSLILLAGPTMAQSPDDFDPLLDASPDGTGREQPVPTPDIRAPGSVIGTHVGAYVGAVRSYLTTDLSTLESASRVNVGFGFGYRTPSLIELGVDLDLGLGQTYEPIIDGSVFAFDLLVEPRILAHAYETEDWSLYGGLGALSILFDLELAGINQAGAGPTFIVGFQYRSDQHSLFYLEASGTAFYDALAYRYREPTEAELMADPLIDSIKVDGDWFSIFRFTLGYKLTAL